jgi:hypothetical protein|tara:strand:- start:10521 stop:10970 length:450 start_codon:yes stop_codon:yes gene_type:complete
MADLVTTVTESLVLNGSLRGSTNTVTTQNIVDVFERIVSCTHSQDTIIAVFDTHPYSSPGAIDRDNAKYIRITNLDTANEIELAVVGVATSYIVRLRAGASHILYNGDDIIKGAGNTTIVFGVTDELANLEARPIGTEDIQLEIFVGLV